MEQIDDGLENTSSAQMREHLIKERGLLRLSTVSKTQPTDPRRGSGHPR